MKIICIIILAAVVSLHVVFLLLLTVPMHMHACKIFSILLDLFVVTVDKPGFRKMLECFDSWYELPTRKYFTQTFIPMLYSKAQYVTL